MIQMKQTHKRGLAYSSLKSKYEKHSEKYLVTSLYIFRIKIFSFYKLVASNL